MGKNKNSVIKDLRSQMKRRHPVVEQIMSQIHDNRDDIDTVIEMAVYHTGKGEDSYQSYIDSILNNDDDDDITTEALSDLLDDEDDEDIDKFLDNIDADEDEEIFPRRKSKIDPLLDADLDDEDDDDSYRVLDTHDTSADELIDEDDEIFDFDFEDDDDL